MAFSITCPHCSAKLKTTTAIAAGRSVACPKCKSSFAVSRDNIEEIPDTKAGAASSAASASRSAPPARSRASDDENPYGGIDETGKKRRRDEEDEEDDDDRPRKRGRGDDDDMPRSRKRVDDDRPNKRKVDDDNDDGPRSRKRASDDDEDDRPRSRKRVDDDDDRPRSRKRVIDDDDDDRPRRRGGDDDDFDDDRPRKKKKKRKSRRGLMIGLTIGGVIAVAGIVFLCIWMFGGGGYDKEMISYMPENTAIVGGADVAKLMEVDFLKDMADKGLPGAGNEMKLLKDAGVSINDLSKVMFGSPDPEAGAKGGVAIFRFKRAVDKSKINGTLKASEQKIGGKSYFKGASVGCIYFPKDDLVVVAENEETMKKILDKEEGKVSINENLKELAGKVGGGHFWVATSSNLMSKNAPNQGGGMFNPVGFIGSYGSGNADITNAMKGLKGLALKIDIDNTTVKVYGVAKCSDAAVASKASDAFSKIIKDQKTRTEEAMRKAGSEASSALGDTMRDILDSLNVSNSGDMLQGEVKFRYDSIKNQIKGGLPFK